MCAVARRARRRTEHPMQVGDVPARDRGFTYLGLLCAVAVLSIGLLVGAEVWVTSLRRERMQQLEWVGGQFVQAIGSYYESSPGAIKLYPPTLEALVEDRRYLTTKRHLRRIYLNPFTNRAQWEVVLHPSGGIVGIRAQTISPDGGPSWKEYRYHALLP